MASWYDDYAQGVKDAGVTDFGGAAAYAFSNPLKPLERPWNWLKGEVDKADPLGLAKYQPQGYSFDPNASQIPGNEGWRKKLSEGAAGAGGRGAYQLGSASTYGGAKIDPWLQAQVRDKQMDNISALEAQARGEGPSVARETLQQGVDANLAAALSMAANQKSGAGYGGTMRALENQRSAITQQGAADAALLSLQEQMQARNQLGQMLQGARGLDIGLATDQARLSQEAGLFSAGARNQFALGQGQLEVQQRQLNDQMVRDYLAMGLSLDQAQMQANLKMQEMRMQEALARQGIEAQQHTVSQQQKTNVLGAAGQGLAMYAASDENLKTDVRDGDEEVYSFLDALEPKSYRYKEPELDGDGEQLSVMAQALEKSKTGKRLVVETKRGKYVDYGKALPILLASEAAMHRRLKKLEGKR